MTNPTWKIIAKHSFTLFNFVNLILAAMIFFVGSYKNLLFIIIAIANTFIGIINELRAKKIVDKMRLISEQNPTIIRNGKPYQISPKSVQKGDLTVLSLGDQILFDSTVKEGNIEVNESFITGEQNSIAKHPGDQLISGSFVVSGTAKAVVENIGSDNFVTKLQNSASTIKTADSKLFTLMNKIVKYISYALIPIGILLLWSRFRVSDTTTEIAITSTVASLINMIPEGLILLTSSVLALATIRLGKKQVLVQDLYSIETLARVDCIALDKTGTLTTGKMVVHDILLPNGTSIDVKTPRSSAEKRFLAALTAILSHQMSENATTTALKQKLLKTPKIKAINDFPKITETIPFSSDRKYSGIKTKNADYLMGATEFITKDPAIISVAKSFADNYRVLAVIKKDALSSGKVTPVERARSAAALPPYQDTLLGFILLDDELRSDAKEIINYFYDNDIAIKIISGDAPRTVRTVAEKAGLRELSTVDLSSLDPPFDYSKLVKTYNIFTRVKPAQKKFLISALKKQGLTVAMTGDGVNDILAMKEADVSLAIGEGSDAARRSAKLVLLNSDFSSVPSIIDEGRQSINNLERSTALFLAKTVYASTLALVFVFLSLEYPFSPIEMSLLNTICIGLPGLILALEKNTARIKNKFLSNILHYSAPIGFTVSVAMIILSIFAHFNDFSRPEFTAASFIITFILDVALIYWISKPLNRLRGGLIAFIIAVAVLVFLFSPIRKFFEFTLLPLHIALITAAIVAISFIVFAFLRYLSWRYSSKLRQKLHI